jgi:hypothetical protein
MAQRDFIVDLTVDQRGTETYVTEMDLGAAAIDDITAQINRINFRGVRVAANGKGLSDRMRREAERRRKDAQRTIDQTRKIAEGLQRAVVREVGAGLARPSASTGKLAKVTASNRNASFTTTNNRVFLGVGSIQWLLNNKQVRYALAIEGGSQAAVGRKITGLWMAGTGRPTGFGRPTKTQTFVAMSAKEASKTLVAAGRKSFRVSGIIHTPILPHGDYRTAVQKYQPERRTIDAIRRIYGTGS